MRKSIFYIILLIQIAVLSTPLKAEDKVKKGWNIGPLPAIGYNSDLGFQYGVLADIFWFGDGSTFPNYLHKFNVEVSQYTKGSGVYHFFYDSGYLFKGIRTTVDISYLTDKMMDFTGFNGYMSNFNLDFADRFPSFYKMDRKLFRTTIDMQGRLAKNLNWAAGLALFSYKTSEVKLEKYLGEENLYSLYVEEGIIDGSEAKGGYRIEAKLGMVHDTRDNESDPTRGFWTESILFGAPLKGGYLKASVIHRGYLPIYKERLTFAYRLAVQPTILGEAPFFMQQNLSTLYFRQITSEGLGGVNTLRGVMRNRVIGSGVAWANFEIRFRFLNFRMFKQDWYLALNPFFDAGRVIQYYKKREMELSDNADVKPLAGEKFHLSAGAGIKAIMNRNFIVSVEWGKPFDKRDGLNGMNVGLNYIF